MDDAILKEIGNKGANEVVQEVKELSLKFFVNPDVVLIIYMTGMKKYEKLLNEYLKARKQSKQKE